MLPLQFKIVPLASYKRLTSNGSSANTHKSNYVHLHLATPPSVRGLVIPIFVFLFGSTKQILVASFTTQVRARILSGRSIFGALGEGQQRWGQMPLGLFLFSLNMVLFHLKTNASKKIKSINYNLPVKNFRLPPPLSGTFFPVTE